MRILSEGNRILWINSIGMRRPAASSRDLRRLLKKFKQGLEGYVRINENFYVWSPLVVPIPGLPVVDHLNTAILSASLHRLTQRLDFRRPILWSFLPNVNNLVGNLGESMVIYHCVDEYGAFSGVSRESVERMERDLVAKADLVFTSSVQLCRERQRYNPRTFFVSHGVDLRHFSMALDPHTPIPPDMHGFRSPMVGFFGLIADWLDLSIIRHIALNRPDWSVVLVGKVTTDLGPLKGLPNVHFLGQKPYESLPSYCKAFDVGIIPFQINELTLKANPLKLREYLAAGLPVVSADLPEIRKYQEVVRIASSPDLFLSEIDAALREQGGPHARRRMEAIKEESWEVRVEQLSAFIQSFENSRLNGLRDVPR
jgi:glycosyltransferase involved in cell wall biosynthesis